jgi:aspartate kinase
MIVMKFGGSSVKDAEMFKNVFSIVKSKIDKKPIVVLSAVKGTTDQLITTMDEALNSDFSSYHKIIEKHKKIISDLNIDPHLLDSEFNELKETLDVINHSKEHNKQMLDYICFFGERMCVKILAEYMELNNIDANSVISGDAGLITDSKFGDATILETSYDAMNNFFSNFKSIPVVTGFGGKDEMGEFTTFNRGGSDYVAALIGAAINAEAIEIWTDVSGIMSCDPRLVENVKYIPELSFDEASELAYFGAKVLHPKTIWPAIKKDIPVYVLNTYEPEHLGSKIVKNVEKKKEVTGLTYKKGITVITAKSTRMINAHGYLSRIFQVFEKYKKPVDMLSTSEVSVSMTVDSKENIPEIINELKDIAHITTGENKAVIYVVGENIFTDIDITGHVFSIMSNMRINIEMVSICFSGISIGFIIDEDKAQEAIKELHSKLINHN